MKIILTGGGSGGHLMPLIAVTRELQRLPGAKNIVIHYIGPKDAAWFSLFKEEKIKPHGIISGKLRNYFSFLNITDILFKMPIGFAQSFFLLLFSRPKLVFSKGGTGALPVTFCARLLRIPVWLHESDMVPGKANKITSKWAKIIFTSFEKTANLDPRKIILVGNPIRKEITEGDIQSAKEIFNLSLQKPVLLFWGGSLGARAIDDFLLIMANELLKKYEVIAISGKNNYKTMQAESLAVLDKNIASYYHLYESLDEISLKHALAAADLVISRAGSGSIFEIAACQKPAILIPIPAEISRDQLKNAYAYSNTGAAVTIEQENLTPHFFMGRIDYILSQPAQIETMKQAALAFSKPLAAQTIAEKILTYLENKPSKK